MADFWEYRYNKEAYEKLKLAQSGQVVQLRKYKFVFNVYQRLDVIEWLEEHSIEYTEKDAMYLSFTTIYEGSLAMEFKLRFINV